MITRLFFSFVLVILFYISGCAKEGNSFVRINSDTFQVARKTFVSNDKNKPKVTLLGVVHIGEKRYYEEIQRYLDRADVVLYESVGSQAEITELKNKCPEVLQGGSLVDHKVGAEQLELVRQKDHIREAKHFVHADYSYTQLFDGLGIALGKPFCERFHEATDDNGAFLKKSDKIFQDTSPTTSRNLLALLLTKSLHYENKEGNNDIIIFRRNDWAFNIFKEQLLKCGAGQELVIFYGAAHMPDFEDSLNKLNFYEDDIEWFNAFSL